jgi:hypothetical protein
MTRFGFFPRGTRITRGIEVLALDCQVLLRPYLEVD